MQLVCELAKIAAHTSREKQANPAALMSRLGSGLSRIGGAAAKFAPKSTGGRVAAGLGAAGGLHLGQDAFRSYNTGTPDLQQYYDQNQMATKALAQRAARMKAPSGFPDQNVEQLVGPNAPQLDVEAPANSFLRFMARPVHETRMNLGGDPGAYKPPASKGSMPVEGGGRQITNADGTVTTLGPATAPTATSQHTNRSKLVKWLADMDAAQTGAAVNRYQQEGAQILPKAQESLGQNIQATRGAHQAGNQQYSQSRARTEALWRQLGLDPSNMPQELGAPDTSGAEKNLDTLTRVNSGQPVGPPTRGVEDYSVEELGQIVARRQAEAEQSAARQKAVQDWLQKTLGIGGGQAEPSAPTAGAPNEMERRRNRMRDLSRTWNAY